MNPIARIYISQYVVVMLEQQRPSKGIIGNMIPDLPISSEANMDVPGCFLAI